MVKIVLSVMGIFLSSPPPHHCNGGNTCPDRELVYMTKQVRFSCKWLIIPCFSSSLSKPESKRKTNNGNFAENRP